MTKELGEKTESQLAEEHARKGLEAKVSAAEKQLSQLQVSPASRLFMMFILSFQQLHPTRPGAFSAGLCS